MTPLNPDQVKALLEHIGFGNPSSSYWFIGMEERGEGTPRELATRAQWKAIEDLHLAHSIAPYNEGFDSRSTLIPTWSAMIKMILRLSGDSEWSDRERIRRYQADQFGRVDGQGFLTEILPLPALSTGHWPYAWLYADRDAYSQAILPGRLAMLRDLVDTHQPQYVVCYGKTYWRYHKQLFPGTDFGPVADGKAEIGTSGTTTVALMPFFSPYWINNDLLDAVATAMQGRAASAN